MMATTSSLPAACLLRVPGLSAEAVTLCWTFLGSSKLWSDAANGVPRLCPATVTRCGSAADDPV